MTELDIKMLVSETVQRQIQEWVIEPYVKRELDLKEELVAAKKELVRLQGLVEEQHKFIMKYMNGSEVFEYNTKISEL